MESIYSLNLKGSIPFSIRPSLPRPQTPSAHASRSKRSPPMSRMTEAPFVPRERLKKHQQCFQSIHKHTHLKGRFDKITSVAIPLALAASTTFLIARGIYNMSLGTGKKE